jgi:4-amino-4-deoxy-L-arabinose transferase-like glycosyltransferase
MTSKSSFQHSPRRHSPIRALVRPLTLPLILLLAAAVRLYNLSSQSLWADEGNSVALAQRSFSEIAQHTAFDIHPPLYYWLLKLWVSVFGDSELGLRSLSVVLGLGLVYVISQLGRRLFSPRLGLMAAFIAALAPLQVYYSQEARMYMLLACLSSLTVLAALLLWSASERRPAAARPWVASLAIPLALLYLLSATAGLYTHYAYPLILLAVNLAALLWFWQMWGRLVNWLLLQLLPWLLYLPWLPTAWRQITTWPAEQHSASLLTVVETSATTLLFGPSWPFNYRLILAGALALLLTLSLRPLTYKVLLLWLWFGLPVALTVVIFSPAFLKFLLVASPALAVLLALSIAKISQYFSRTWLGYGVGAILLVGLAGGSALSLYHYYFDPTFARDNYRAIASFIKAVSGPDDAVILNAEGQQDVFNYYYARPLPPAAPVYALPRRRPLDEAATLAELQALAVNADQVYAVYWATQQADPHGLIEGWLDTHLFKATDQWYGNVRLVSYATPQSSTGLPLRSQNYYLGPHLRLLGYATSASPLTAGDILPISLVWQTDTPLKPEDNYTVFLQVLDSANHVVGQRDAPFGLAPSSWPVNHPITDTYGLFIEPGTPPGPHRLIVGLYDSQTGQRLPISSSLQPESKDFIELQPLEIMPAARPLPLEAFQIQVPLHTALLEVTLLGYDLYKLGHRSDPDTPLHSGDPLQLVAYWQVNQPVTNLADQLLVQVVSLSGQATPVSITVPPAGVNYPIQQWRPGEIIRAQYMLFLHNLPPGVYRLALTLSQGEVADQPAVALTRPFQVE